MRILHVVTLVTPDGAYGGPLRVAVNQVRSLTEAGHQVELVAGSRGFDGKPPRRFMGLPVTLFRATTMVPGIGFAGLASPLMLIWLAANVRRFDVVHVHLARDLVTLPAAAIARAAGVPYVVQTHGMIDASGRALAAPLDLVLTKPILRRAGAALCLTGQESDDLLLLIGDQGPPLHHLPNGVPAAGPAATGSEGVEVLFLARLHARKRPLHFVAMAERLHAEFTAARFRLVGPDEGEGPAVQQAIVRAGLSDVIRWEGALEPARTLDRMAASAIYVLPSVDEPFGMTVLEAMSQGIPVVIAQSCGLAAQVSSSGSGLVFDDTLDGLTEAVRKFLADADLREDAGARARATAIEEFGMSGVVHQLHRFYVEAHASARRRSWRRRGSRATVGQRSAR